MGSNYQEICLARDTAIFLFHQLGIMINWKKSILEPQTKLEFLGITIDSISMTLSLPETKGKNLTSLCQEILISPQITLRKLASLIEKLRATAPTIIPAPLQIQNLQQCLIQAQQQNLSFKSLITLNRDCVMELVGNKFALDEGETHTHVTTSNDNYFRCSQNRGLESCITGNIHRGDLGAGREPTAHQHSGANSSRTGNNNFYKRE